MKTASLRLRRLKLSGAGLCIAKSRHNAALPPCCAKRLRLFGELVGFFGLCPPRQLGKRKTKVRLAGQVLVLRE